MVIGRIEIIGEMKLDEGKKEVKGNEDWSEEDEKIDDRRIEEELIEVFIMK